MAFEIVALVLLSAALHPVWNLIVKRNPDTQLGYFILTITMCFSSMMHGLLTGADFSSAFAVLPLLLVSVCGQFLYGTCLTATFERGDLSAYYPIIRASPVFVVVVSVVLFSKTYPAIVLLGIAMAVGGGFLLLYRRGSRILDNPGALGLALLAMSGTGIYSLADARLMDSIQPSVLVFMVTGPLVIIYAAMWFRKGIVMRWRAMGPSGWEFAYLLLPGVLAYASYCLILLAYQRGGEVAAVTSVRQASIPISVALGGMFLREGAMARRFFAAGLLAVGIVFIAMNG